MKPELMKEYEREILRTCDVAIDRARAQNKPAIVELRAECLHDYIRAVRAMTFTSDEYSKAFDLWRLSMDNRSIMVTQQIREREIEPIAQALAMAREQGRQERKEE